MEKLAAVEDPRQAGKVVYELDEVLAIVIVTVLCGADSYSAMAMMGAEMEEWFRDVLGLAGPMPSLFEIRRVLELIEPKEFSLLLNEARHAVADKLDSDCKRLRTVAIDGKVLRGSASPAKGIRPVWVVSAYDYENCLTLAQAFVAEKTNEISGTKEILGALALKGCVVTMDAMGCQVAHVETIMKKGGHYMIALKGNQGELAGDVELFFEAELGDPLSTQLFTSFTTVGKGHGRIETREYTTCGDVSWLNRHKWKGLASIWRVRSTRFCNGKETTEIRYYISSLEADAATYSKHIREHWSIENQLHYVLDVGFGEDSWQMRNRAAAKNLATVKKLTLQALQTDAKAKVGIANRRLKAAVSTGYREEMTLKIFRAESFM